MGTSKDQERNMEVEAMVREEEMVDIYNWKFAVFSWTWLGYELGWWYHLLDQNGIPHSHSINIKLFIQISIQLLWLLVEHVILLLSYNQLSKKSSTSN